MSVDLNHTIVHAHDKWQSAAFLADILGLEVGKEWGPFLPVSTGNGVTLDYMTTTGDVATQHYAFLVSEEEFDAIFARVEAAGVTYYPDPHLGIENEINHNDGGRGFYFLDPDGHGMEVLTVPYGGWPT
jgi:catechol 2,3-dioxygenase-like lactoylglutathione lyase family enzyme